MLRTYLRSSILAFLLICAIFSAVIILACSKNKDEEEKPEIVGCSEVKYSGTTWLVGGLYGGCGGGVSSFRTEITQNGKKACFEVTCNRNGCIASVTVCNSQGISPLAPAE